MQGYRKKDMRLNKGTIKLLHGYGLTYSDIGDIFNITAGRVGQIVNHKSYLDYKKDYARKNILVINGKVTKVNKRSRPNNCEVCGKAVKRLNYHHWDDEKPEYGIWVCLPCHHMVEGIDRGLHGKYLSLRKHILFSK